MDFQPVHVTNSRVTMALVFQACTNVTETRTALTAVMKSTTPFAVRTSEPFKHTLSLMFLPS